MPDIRITGLRICEGKADREAGVWARFECLIGPLRIDGCALRVGEDERLHVVMPRCRSSSGSIRFADRADYLRLNEAARATYVALGGSLPADDA